MPQIEFKTITDFSSEDSAKQLFANNLLKTQDFKSWKCSEWQPNSYVILDTSEPQVVKTIEIGNDCSGFVEVLVANSLDTKPRFQVLLSTSSFMTPSESHNLTNCHRIRHFPIDKLSPNSRNDCWNRFKIVCSQPFNKTIPYGLAFIRFSSPEEKDEEMDTNSTVNNFGVFKLKTTSDDDESDANTGSMFSKRNTLSSESPKLMTRSSLASAVGLSSNTSKTTSHTTVKPKPKTPQVVANSSNNTKSVTNSAESSSPPKRQRQMKKDVPFDQIMSKVVFTLSGFVNPKRSDLRDKGLQMGAKYRPDWDQMCTHLICAFANTPKYNEVMAKKGRIVKEKWIEDSFEQKRRIYWRNYILGKYNGVDSEESEEEAQTASPVVLRTKTKRRYFIDDDDEEESQMKEVIGFGSDPKNKESESQNNDTNDEIYDMETDNESTGAEPNVNINSKSRHGMAENIESIPLDIFKERYFHFYGVFDENEKQVLKEYIVKHNGKISDELTQNVRYVLTHSQWNEDFEQACSSNDLLQIVKPKWIHKCAQKSKLIPFQPFVVTYDCD